jgi:hypothetical protein
VVLTLRFPSLRGISEAIQKRKPTYIIIQNKACKPIQKRHYTLFYVSEAEFSGLKDLQNEYNPDNPKIL